MDRTLFDMLSYESSVALAISDTHGRITMTTPGLRKMLGSDVHSLGEESLRHLGMRNATDDRLLTAGDMPMVRATGGEVVRDEVLYLRRPDDLVVYLRVSAAPLRGHDAEISGAIALVQDVTAEWTAARKQSELRDQLVATVNHELRTPLTKILGHCALLAEFASDQDETMSSNVRFSVGAIERAGHELAALAQRVTALADLEATTRIETRPLNLKSLVAREIEAVRTRSINDDHVRVVFDSPEIVVTADEHLVAWAIRELLENAFSHAPRGSQVRVAIDPQDGHVQISIADTGVGIPKPDWERVVKPFERVGSPDPSDSSPGLGLAVASAVAASHGGSLTLAETDPHGLTVRVCLLRHTESS